MYFFVPHIEQRLSSGCGYTIFITLKIIKGAYHCAKKTLEAQIDHIHTKLFLSEETFS